MHPAVARASYFALQRIRGEPLQDALADVRRTEWWSLEQLRDLQAIRQLEQLRFALHHVPYYRRMLEPLRGEIARARTWEDVERILGRMRIIEKGSVLDDPQDFTAEHAATLPTYLDKTSGSSGTPLTFPCDQRAWAYRHALTHRCIESFGVAVGEPYALFFGLHWNKRSRVQVALRDRVLNRVRISAYEIGPSQLASQFATIRRFRPTHFQGYPSAIYEFCVLASRAGFDLRALRLKAVFTTAEPLRDHQRALISEVTGAPCANMYGSAEGGMTAIECPAGRLHTTPEATWLQLRDTATHTGEAIVTDMMLRAFPMIRYALGDEIVLSREACPCGRAQPVIASIEGRSGEPIMLPNGRTINANLPSYIFKPFGGLGILRRYRFVQRGRDLELMLVVTDAFRPEHLEQIEQETRNAFGADTEFRITIVSSLPHLANAKHRDYVRVD